jgi:hypothetical protein
MARLDRAISSRWDIHDAAVVLPAMVPPWHGMARSSRAMTQVGVGVGGSNLNLTPRVSPWHGMDRSSRTMTRVDVGVGGSNLNPTPR